MLSVIAILPQLTFAQSGRFKPPEINRRISAEQLAWYSTRLRTIRRAPAGTQPAIFAATTRGAQRSEVGINLPASGDAFRTTGTTVRDGTGNEICDVESVQMNYLTQSTFNLYNHAPSSTIFPGAFVDARTLLRREPAFMPAANRAPVSVRLSISNPRNGAPDTTTISDFGVNSLGVLKSNLRDRHLGAAFPALIVARTEVVRTVEEFQAKAEVAAGVVLPLEELGIPLDVGANVNASGGVRTETRVNTYVMTLVQPMYSYGVTTVDKSRLFSAPGSPSQNPNALMVSSVVFGRRALIVIRSTFDQTTVEGAVRARLGLQSTGGSVFEVGARVDASITQRFNQVAQSFQATFYGGNAGRANAVVADPGVVAQYLTDPSSSSLTASTGEVPIEYTLEPVGTDGTIGVRSSGNFDASTCVEPRYRVEVQYRGLKVMRVDEGPGDDREDIFGTISVADTRLKMIPENAAQSIALREHKADDIRVVISDAMSLGELRSLRLNFSQSLKDWEPAHKPEYRPRQPLDLQYDMARGPRLANAVQARRGQAIPLDRQTQEIVLYENGEPNRSTIAIMYSVIVTRK